jgi:hypothetical protein
MAEKIRARRIERDEIPTIREADELYLEARRKYEEILDRRRIRDEVSDIWEE